MRVSIDPSVCTGHGLCYIAAPAVFSDDDQGCGQTIGNDGQVPDGPLPV
jgi:ferredoxin